MKAAFIVMSILGCDDSGANCLPVASVNQQWQTIASCDAASEKHLAKYVNINYPMVVAVCQTANTTALSDSTEDAEGFESASRSIAPVPQPVDTKVEEKAGITARAIAIMKDAIPTKQGLKQTVTTPVHFVTDTYSWVSRKIID
jgi:hypothetical protein